MKYSIAAIPRLAPDAATAARYWWPHALVVGLVAKAVIENIHNETAPLFYLMPLVLPGMYERKWGRIIGIAMHPTRLSPAYTDNLGKAARVQAMLFAHEQAWAHGVTINSIAPGPVPVIKNLEDAIKQSELGVKWQ